MEKFCHECTAKPRRRESLFCSFLCESDAVKRLERHYRPPRKVAEEEGLDVPVSLAGMDDMYRDLFSRVSLRFQMLEFDN